MNIRAGAFRPAAANMEFRQVTARSHQTSTATDKLTTISRRQYAHIISISHTIWRQINDALLRPLTEEATHSHFDRQHEFSLADDVSRRG